jgi:hypothetical protein
MDVLAGIDSYQGAFPRIAVADHLNDIDLLKDIA